MKSVVNVISRFAELTLEAEEDQDIERLERIKFLVSRMKKLDAVLSSRLFYSCEGKPLVKSIPKQVADSINKMANYVGDDINYLQNKTNQKPVFGKPENYAEVAWYATIAYKKLLKKFNECSDLKERNRIKKSAHIICVKLLNFVEPCKYVGLQEVRELRGLASKFNALAINVQLPFGPMPDFEPALNV